MLGAGIRIGAARRRHHLPSVALTPFTLAQIGSAMLANWDARAVGSVSLTSAAVGAWTDGIGNRTLSQAAVGMKPAYGATAWDGALPAVIFDGSQVAGFGDILTTTAALADRMWVFALIERAAANQGDGAGSLMKAIMTLSRASDNVYSQFGFIRPTSDAAQTLLRVSAFGDASNLASAGGGMAKGTKGVVFADMGRAIRNNSGGAAAIVGSGTATRSELSLGGSLSADHNRTAVKVAQIAIIDPTLLKGDGADNQRWVIEGFLAHAWGIAASLPDTHPFKAVAPIASDWTNNAREIVTWGNSLCNGFSPSIPGAWATGYPSTPPITNGGVGGETSTQIRARFDAANPRLHECIVVIGEMFTNGNGGGSNPTTRQHIDAMVARVLASGGRPIVLDHHVNNLNGDAVGGSNRAIVDADNASLREAYPDHFLDVSDFVYRLGAPGAIYDDPTNYGLGLPPATAMADNIHYTATVYAMIGPHCIGHFIQTKGWDR